MMNIFAILVIGGIAYLWMTRGFFSAMLHMACTLVAGAIAFAFWEPLSLLILEKSPQSGFLSFLRDSAWAIGLIVPFAASLALLRAAVDKALPLNAQTESLVNYLGGGFCGVVSGGITAGIIVLAIGMLRMDSNFWGYQSLRVGGRGSIETGTKLIVPVDRFVAGMYGRLSETSLATSEPLTKWYPDFADVPASMRMSNGDGKDRNTLSPKDVTVYSRYSLGKDRQGGSLTDLLRDAWNPGSSQMVFDPNGEAFPSDSHIEGFVIQLSAGAREKHGQIVVGNAQVRLLVEDARNPDDVKHKTLYPIAVATRAAANELLFGRFRLDSQVFIAPSGAGADTRMAFEFVIPSGHQPLALYVKNARVKPTPIVQSFKSPEERDMAVQNGSVFGTEVQPALVARPTIPTIGQPTQTPQDFGIQLNNTLGHTIQKGGERGLQLDGLVIIDGEARFAPNEMRRSGEIARELRVDTFMTTQDTAIVKIDVGASSASSILGMTRALAESVVPPFIVDTNGTRYEAVGFVYEDRDIVVIRFTPGRPIRGLTELPTRLSRSRTDQKCTLIFRVNAGVSVAKFMLGEETVTEFGPFVVQSQRRR
ncbi:MAG: hypothetical protein KF902_11575 [Phycisphaeraceae bacterium]|nr:hypothetical protein [Phycisphaeraceae bacterium]